MLDISDSKSVESRRSPSGSTYKVFTFECKNCGIDIKSQISQLKTHSGMCRSCSQKKKPYEHILNELVHSCQKRKNHEVSINYDYFINLIKDSKCHYCDKELDFSKHTRDKYGKYASRAYQLDRMDNSKGYVEGNLVTCCWNCNRMKSDIYSYEDFMKLSPILRELN
jgi:hypothetical protein